jgi:hypothetical protein
MLLQEYKIGERNGGHKWKGWKISKTQTSFSNIIQQVKEIQYDHRRVAKSSVLFNQNL